jgi:protein-tyrosine-phosphatase
MKILFVCRSNVGRSQVCEELYNLKTNSTDASSAGTKVDIEGQLVSDRKAASGVIAAMKDLGVDIASNRSNQVTPKMLENFDKVIVMAEPETIPSWLSGSPNYVRWVIEDMKDSDSESARKIIDILQTKVNQLVKD